MSESENKVRKTIGAIIIMAGLFLCGVFGYSILWQTLLVDPTYWWYLIIGGPLVLIGIILFK